MRCVGLPRVVGADYDLTIDDKDDANDDDAIRVVIVVG